MFELHSHREGDHDEKNDSESRDEDDDDDPEGARGGGGPRVNDFLLVVNDNDREGHVPGHRPNKPVAMRIAAPLRCVGERLVVRVPPQPIVGNDPPRRVGPFASSFFNDERRLKAEEAGRLKAEEVSCFPLRENSASSMVFRSTPILQLRQIVETWTVDFDQCMSGRRPPAPGPSEYIRKTTTILGNRPSILRLANRCQHSGPGHVHVRALGSRTVRDGPHSTRSISVAAWAGQYPLSLCRSLAKLVKLERDRRGRCVCASVRVVCAVKLSDLPPTTHQHAG